MNSLSGTLPRFSPKKPGTLREVYSYCILAHMMEGPELKTTAKVLAQGLSIPFNATFYRACEHVVELGLVQSEGRKATKRYWLANENRGSAQVACRYWANLVTLYAKRI